MNYEQTLIDLDRKFPPNSEELMLWKLQLPTTACYFADLLSIFSDHGPEPFNKDFFFWKPSVLEESDSLQRTCMLWLEHLCKHEPDTVSWRYSMDSERIIIIMVCGVCIGSMEDDCSDTDLVVRNLVISNTKQCEA